jgi:hypothetical protein
MSSKLAAAAAADSNSSDEKPIGKKSMAKVQAPVADKTGGVFAGAASAKPKVAAAASAPPPAAAPARNASLAPILRRPAATAAAASSAAPVLVSQGAAATGSKPPAKPPAKPTAAATAAAAVEVAGGPAVSALVDKKVKPAVVIGVPGDAPLMAEAGLTGELKARLTGTKERLDIITPVMISNASGESVVPSNKYVAGPSTDRVVRNEYRPISSASFPDFIIQAFNQYSPYLQRVLTEGRAAAAVAKPLNKNACKERPTKLETFYYQNFVRDYLSRGTPYRGLLVYHGLGTGKTCTSIAAAEALYWGGQKTIYIMTPATLSSNYRKDLGKCGYYPLRTNNHWAFIKLTESGTVKNWLIKYLGLPEAIIDQQGGGWVPNPDIPSNWDTLSPDVHASILSQQKAHMAHRFRFIHYNGITPTILSKLAAAGVAEGKSMFDDAVVVIDEVHNLVRTINGSEIGGKPMSRLIQGGEPREPTWSTPIGRQRPGFRYPRGYTLYRLLQNAVGAKIIVLSATPMINYAQELAILLNIIGGEQRAVEIPLVTEMDEAAEAKLVKWAQTRPDIDYYNVEVTAEGKRVLLVTPVPYGFTKVVREDFSSRGFVRELPENIKPVGESRERNMDHWAVTLIKDLEAKVDILKGLGFEAETAVTAARAANPSFPTSGVEGTGSAKTHFSLRTYPLLPEDKDHFVDNFINRNTLELHHHNVLTARATGLVSYYRGGSEELMPRPGRNELVLVPFSDYAYKNYVAVRMEELKEEPPEEEDDKKSQLKRKGMTAAEVDLYTQATQAQAQGFMCGSRAACNFTFPDGVEMPLLIGKEKAKLLGLEQDRILAANYTEAVNEAEEGGAGDDLPEAAAAASGAAAAGSVEGIAAAALQPTTEGEPEEAVVPVDAKTSGITNDMIKRLKRDAPESLNRDLAQYSPKYAAMIANIRLSPGPVLVYSQFKTLEGLGIFAAALEMSDEHYNYLDIVKVGGVWQIPPELLTPAEIAKPRYILYTGDQALEKRRILLQLYNADLENLPPKLKEQCTLLLQGAEDNRDGRVCRVFMITQSGAEGISMLNTRQVHIMESYWNNVRLQQVIGRAIRLCSHMNLEWDDRVVDIFTYLSVMTPEQQAMAPPKMKWKDGGKTTDQTIHNIATRKQELANRLADVLQSSATDCQLHFNEHGSATQCFQFQAGSRPMFLYHPNWRKDLIAATRGRPAAAGAGGAAEE